MSTRFPSKWISPSSRVYAPERILISVDLPAPFSPSSACTWPSRTERLTPSSAFTPGNDLPMSRISRSTRPVTCSLITAPHLRWVSWSTDTAAMTRAPVISTW